MPGNKLKSIKPAGRKMYEKLKGKLGKTTAAKIANAWARDDGKADGKRAKKKGKRK